MSNFLFSFYIFQIKCKSCGCSFNSHRSLYEHKLLHNSQRGGSSSELKQFPFVNKDPPWISDKGVINQELKDEYMINTPLILCGDMESKLYMSLTKYYVLYTNHHSLSAT